MKTLYLAAALLMASTAAHAGNSISFEIDGHRIHIQAPKNCDQLSCIQITAPGLSTSSFNLKSLTAKSSGDDDDVADLNPPAAKTAPQAPAPVATSAPPAAAATASTAPAVADTIAPINQAPVAASTASSQPERVTAVIPSAQPAPVAAAAPAPVAAAPAPAPTTPLGLWATEENKGNVRIEQCGQNLCGYADKSGEKILINMKPSDNKWVGRIHDPDSGSNYDSTIAMKGSNTLKVQGCAFGGLFCGGQTWKRIS
jgi:uncharacterized protein (DUF2147 family)